MRRFVRPWTGPALMTASTAAFCAWWGPGAGALAMVSLLAVYVVGAIASGNGAPPTLPQSLRPKRHPIPGEVWALADGRLVTITTTAHPSLEVAYIVDGHRMYTNRGMFMKAATLARVGGADAEPGRLSLVPGTRTGTP